MEVQGSYGRLIQGISQQPAAVRLQGQGADQINTVPDVVDGLKTRMGSKHKAKLMNTLVANSAMHHYRRGEGGEEYFFVMQPNRVPDIFDNQGRKCVLNLEDAPEMYLANTGNPLQDVQFLTIADYTFILNRNKVVKARPQRTPKAGNTAIVFSAYATYGTTYKIFINGTEVAAYETLDGGSADHIKSIKTENVASQLYNKLVASSVDSQYTFRLDGTSIYITSNSGDTEFSVTTQDGAKGKDLVAIKYRVNSVDLLPSRAPEGYLVQIWPTGSKPESRYWMKAEKKDGNLVQWKESVGADMLLGFDKATMPYVIVRESIGSDGIAVFKMRQGEWEDRRVGDDLTNPMPSFIDEEAPQAISSMFMVQNRLCFAAGESCVMSRTSYFFDFFRFTVLSALDTDPIDVFADASEVYKLLHAVTLDGDTVLFSDSTQFILAGDKPITKANAILRPATTFENSTIARPVATGESVMFAFDEGANSGIREYFTDSYSDTKKAQPVTSHVNKLIKGKVLRMVASSNINRLFVLASERRHVVYVYDWLWQGAEKVQSAWHKWIFPTGSIVHSMFYSSELLYLLIERKDGLYLEVMDMGDPLLSGMTDRIRMDRQVTLDFTFNQENLTWYSAPLPYVPTSASMLDAVLVKGWPDYIGGSFIFNYDADTNRLYTKFDLADESEIAMVSVGELYLFEYEPTPVIIKDRRDMVSYLDVPTVGLVYINCDLYPDFTVEVTNLNTEKVRQVVLSNRMGGRRNNIVGYVKPRDGTLRVPIRAKSTDVAYRLKAYSPHTLQVRDIEWEGTYNPSKRRI